MAAAASEPLLQGTPELRTLLLQQAPELRPAPQLLTRSACRVAPKRSSALLTDPIRSQRRPTSLRSRGSRPAKPRKAQRSNQHVRRLKLTIFGIPICQVNTVSNGYIVAMRPPRSRFREGCARRDLGEENFSHGYSGQLFRMAGPCAASALQKSPLWTARRICYRCRNRGMTLSEVSATLRWPSQGRIPRTSSSCL